MTPQNTLDLGLVGNSRIAALIDPIGGIVWWCHPRFDGDPICSALLSGEARPKTGFIDVKLEGQVKSEQQYLPNTPILVTTLTDKSGNSVSITDLHRAFINTAAASIQPCWCGSSSRYTGAPV